VIHAIDLPLMSVALAVGIPASTVLSVKLARCRISSDAGQTHLAPYAANRHYPSHLTPAMATNQKPQLITVAMEGPYTAKVTTSDS
jgi:hypothetical protein